MIDANMGISSENTKNHLVIHFNGNLDVGSTHLIETKLMDLIRNATLPIIYDLERVNYMSSAGLRILITTLHYCEEFSVSLSLCSLKPAVEKVLQITQLKQLFTIHSNLNDALL